MNIILIAPPAAGKGTQSALICEKYNMEHISTGDLLREIVKENSPLSKEIKEKMDKGLFIDNDLIMKLISKKMENSGNYIFDGFPRNIEQAKLFDELLININKKIDYVIYLNIEKEQAIKRIENRLVCPSCGKVYNSRVSNICDKCDLVLEKRTDDTLETFEKRFKIYDQETKPIIEFYKNKGLLYEVDSSLDTIDVFKQIEKIVNIND